VLIPRPSQAEQVASNAWLRADGGCIFADAPNAVTSAAAILRQISMPRNITPLRVIRSSRASSRMSSGSTTIARKNSSPARSFTLLTRTRWINRCPDRPEWSRQTGRGCFTNRRLLVRLRVDDYPIVAFLAIEAILLRATLPRREPERDPNRIRAEAVAQVGRRALTCRTSLARSIPCQRRADCSESACLSPCSRAQRRSSGPTPAIAPKRTNQ
jgi:hypothetical protein